MSKLISEYTEKNRKIRRKNGREKAYKNNDAGDRRNIGKHVWMSVNGALTGERLNHTAGGVDIRRD